MSTSHSSRVVALVSIVTLLLLGCGRVQDASTPAVQPHQTFGERAAWARQSVLRHQLPPEAQSALAQLGFAPTDTVPGGRVAATALPHTLPANDPYSGAGDSGWVTHSLDVGLSPFGMSMAPSGPDYPNNFSFIVYRVDDITQQQSTLDFSFGLLPPGAEVGIAAYNWVYGSLGRWEPLHYGPALDGMSVAFSGANPEYISPGGDLVFVIFCLHPHSMELENIELTTSDVNPNYDELEPNDVFDDIAASLPLANDLPAFPFSGYRGNIGSGGVYDGSVDDYFRFSGAVGDMYKFTITPEFPSPEFFKPLAWDNEAFVIGEYITDPITGVVTVTVVVTTGQEQPLYLNIWHEGLSTDYTIDGEKVTAYGELEHNDDLANANDLGGDKFFVNGNLGDPGVGYDGDSEDFFQFTADFDEQPQLVLWYDATTMVFDFLNQPPQVVDSLGTTMCIGQDGLNFGVPDSILFRFDQPIDGGHFEPFFVNLEPAAGVSNYWLVRLNNYTGP